MTTRTCLKCGDDLSLNQKLGLMECVSGKHIEPVSLQRGQSWNKCPECGQMGVNDKDGEARHQVVEKVDDGKGGKVRVPKIQNGKLVFKTNASQKPVKCRACGYSWTKKEATA